jgi:hypothetical protein
MFGPSGNGVGAGLAALSISCLMIAAPDAGAAQRLPLDVARLAAAQAALETEAAQEEEAQEPPAEVVITATSPEEPEIDISGEVSLGYLTADTDSRLLFGRVFDNQAEQFTLHQAEVWLERASSAESPFGFNVDIVAGDDAEKIHSLGLGDSSDSFDLTQAYVTYQVGDSNLMLKAGKFVTLHGSEVIRRSGNFHYSRSLLFGYAIPFTHTGLMATWTGDAFSITGGIVNGWDNVDDNNEDKSFHAMAGFTPGDVISFVVGGTYGAEGASSSDKRTLIDAIFTIKPTDGLTIMFNYDWAEDQDAVLDPITDDPADAEWDGLAGYISFDFTDAFSLGARAEYFNDDDGFRLGAGPLELWEGTLTARFKLRDGLITSLEYRHDESSDGELVFDDFTEDTQDTIALEIVGSF